MSMLGKKNLKKHGLKLEEATGTPVKRKVFRPEKTADVSITGTSKRGYYLVIKDPFARVKCPLTEEELLAIREVLNKKFDKKVCSKK